MLQRCFNAMPLNMLPFLSGISFPTLSHPAKSYSCFKYLLRDYSAFSYFCLFSRWRYLSLLFSHKLDVTLLLHLRHHIVTFLHIFLMKQEILFSWPWVIIYQFLNLTNTLTSGHFLSIFLKNTYWELFLGQALNWQLASKYGRGTSFYFIFSPGTFWAV